METNAEEVVFGAGAAGFYELKGIEKLSNLGVTVFSSDTALKVDDYDPEDDDDSDDSDWEDQEDKDDDDDDDDSEDD